ncbi:MAG: hypothetical protein JSW11_01625 [Candidatus Heimdallarchaeota archaeon]|nr:MAG: hypothetical protein JSW11_01625 [Candidatus Heimdallarchaeota archaeon]
MTENNTALNQIKIFDLHGKERNIREIRRNSSFPRTEDVSDLTIIAEEGYWIIVFAGLSTDHTNEDEIKIRTTLQRFIQDVEQKHVNEFTDSSLWDGQPLSKIEEMHFKGETSFFSDIRSIITQYFPNLVFLSEIIQKEEIPLSEGEIQRIKTHRAYMQQRARRVLVNIERCLIAGNCYYCQCSKLEIKKEPEVIVSCPDCGKEFSIELRPRRDLSDLDDEYIKRFLHEDPSRVKILPHFFREISDELFEELFKEDILNMKILVFKRDPNKKSLLTEAYLRELKRNE